MLPVTIIKIYIINMLERAFMWHTCGKRVPIHHYALIKHREQSILLGKCMNRSTMNIKDKKKGKTKHAHSIEHFN